MALRINIEAARMDGAPVFESRFPCEMPERLEGNPIAWAYEQIKRAGGWARPSIAKRGEAVVTI